MDLLLKIVRGDLLKELKSLFLNSNNLVSTSQAPSSGNLAKFRTFFDKITRPKRKIKSTLNLYFNHVHIDLAVNMLLPFDDYQFGSQLVAYQCHNFLNNRLSLFHCKTVRSANYLDVLKALYYHTGRTELDLDVRSILEEVSLKPDLIDLREVQKRPSDSLLEKLNSGMADSRAKGEVDARLVPDSFEFRRFNLLYPNIQKVTLDNRPDETWDPSAPDALKPNALLFLKFLHECRALTDLELYWTRFHNANFYQHLNKLFSGIVSTLTTLVMIEEPFSMFDPVDFGFLSKLFILRKFQTNVATPKVALDLVKKIKTGLDFSFHFYDKKFYEKEFAGLDHGQVFKRLDLRKIGSLFNISCSLVDMYDHREMILKKVSEASLEEVNEFVANLNLKHWLNSARVPRLDKTDRF